MDYSPLLSFRKNEGILLQSPAVAPSEICHGESNNERRGSLLHHSMKLFGRLLDLRQPAMVEDVCADHAVKIIVYERKLPHLMEDKSDVVNRGSFQSSFECFEGCFGNVKSHDLKTSFTENYGMTTCPATQIQNPLCALTFQSVCEIHNGREWWGGFRPPLFSPG